MISFYDKDCFKWYFTSFKVDIISIENIIVTDGIITLCAPPRCYVTCGHTMFMTMALATE